MANRNQTRRINRDTIEQQRKTSTNGRLQRTLSTSIFSRQYIACVMSNPEGLLRMPYLIRELQATKRLLKALKKRLHIPWCKALYEKINMLDGNGTPTSPLCAIGRHLMARSMHLDLDSLFFDGCISEWTMETVVHGVTPIMGGLNDLTAEARESFRTIQRGMNVAKAGYVEVGAFEPDLRSIEDFADRAALQRLCEERGWDFPATGGFVLCSHRLVRVQSDALYQSLLHEEFSGYRRVLRKQMDKDKTCKENMDDILAYIWKLEELVNGVDGVVEINEEHCRRSIRTVALGTTTDGFAGLDREDVLCEFALYFDKLGLDFFKINHVNIYARAWYGEDELLILAKQDGDLLDDHGVDDGLHGHCNDEQRRPLFQETAGYPKMTNGQKISLKLAQFGMRTLNTNRKVGPLIPSGRKMESSGDTIGFAVPVIKFGARNESKLRHQPIEHRPQKKRRLTSWEIETIRSSGRR